ncbi:TPR end-of-group domain-containing protein [Phyllobacterium sophorae]|uniref:Adenylate/guanylate cyclase domain-containing protein n=1 Tax=Phyllobacterium sophorae TaxID=1520277 RepID=A0A2P7B5V8_9HYPH|nr:adenylate/guanylate cyclase domain-containing protein [Phyllobacterium sophorae]PSH61854.1 adenylate/guanylate cyclase domain-containing protein [Phyllobacterium sophorae]
MERKLAAILAADVAGYSALMEVDEAGTFERLRARHKDLFEPEVDRYHGRIFKVMGDGLLAEFGSVVDAVECAAALQRGMMERNDNFPESNRIEIRIGINLGEVIIEGEDRYGEGVNIAARLQSLADPGGICVSAKVSREVEKKLTYAFEPMGEQWVKNITEPIACYRVNLNATSPGVSKVLMQNGSAAPKRISIAVLPFSNMSGDPEQEYFSDGITEDIITDLSKISHLHVIARNTTFTYKGRPAKIQQVAQDLGVRFVLEGSVRKAGSRVRVTGQLVGSHLWAERYDRELTDIFAIQDEITHAIVDQLKIKLLPDEKEAINATPTEDVEAYTYYLRGRQFLHMCSKSYMLLARRMFARAAEIDRSYARAYAGIANCDSVLYSWQYADVSIDAILATSAKALELDPDLADAHASRGLALQYGGLRAEAAAEFDRALALDPNLHEANYFYARFFFEQSDFERAAELFERAMRVRSDDYRSAVLLACVYRSLGRHADMTRVARLGLERAELELNLHPENSSPAQLGALALAQLGERDRAKEWAARTLAIDPDDLNALYNIACTYLIMDETEAALDLLEKIIPRTKQIMWWQSDPDLDPIRDHPRYKRLVERTIPG